MSNRIDLTLTPSATAGLLATLPWLALAGLITLAGLFGWVPLLILLPVLAVFAWRSFQRYGLLKGSSAVVGLQADNRGLFCRCRDGQTLPVSVDTASMLGNTVLALKLRSPGATSSTLFTLIISNWGPLPANTPTDDMRRLKMWLRLGHPHSA